VGALEFLEDAAFMPAGDAVAAICYREAHFLCGGESDSDFARPVGCVAILGGVAEEIEQHLAEGIGVGANGHGVFR
jgi:hypothetical protein